MSTPAAAPGFFTNLDNTQPFFKAALEGFAGSGKTFTMAQVAIGLHRRIESKLPIAYYDTEKAGRHLRHLFRAAGISVLHKESRTLADLVTTMRMGREGAFDILLIDSISHVWENFLQSYQKQKGRARLQFEDWGVLKPKWKEEFSEPFVRDRYHAIMCGRAGYEYSDEKDENGKRQIYKSGVKMKVEGETAYEPDMLCYMERFEEILDKDKKKVWRECTVLKDRSTLLDGQTFRNPSYADFAPALDQLLDEPVDRTPAKEGENRFDSEDKWGQERRQREIACGEIQGELVARWPGQTAVEKKLKSDKLWELFGCRGWAAVENTDSSILRAGLVKLRLEPSKAELDEAEKALNALGATPTPAAGREPGAEG